MTTLDFETRCRASFAKQSFMKTLGARVAAVRLGEVVIELPFNDQLTQQHGFTHAGAITSIVDVACGYAALTMMPEGAAVLSVEFKTNFMKPAVGSLFKATGKVLKAGRTLTVCTGVVEAELEGKWSTIAAMQATMMALTDRGTLED